LRPTSALGFRRREVARQIDSTQTTLRTRAQSMRSAVGSINDASTQQYDLIEQLDRSLADLRVQAARLTETVRQFRY
jgi:methyl-accepting chemotaxis protein